MNLQNSYKVIFEKTADGKRTFYASKTGVFADAERISEELEIGKYKLIYEKDGNIYGSETGVPAKNDHQFSEFNKVLKETVEEPVAPVNNKRSRKTTTTTEEPAVVENLEAKE